MTPNFQGTLVLIGFSVDFHTHIWEFSREKTFREHSALIGFSVDFHTHIWEFSREKTFREHSSLLDSRSIFILTSGNFREKKLSGNTRSYWILGRFSYSHLGIFERKNFQGTLVLVGFSVDFHTHIWEFSREKTFREHSSLLDSRSIFILTSGNFREKKLSGNTRPYWILGRFSYSHLGIFERKNFQGTLVLIGFSVDFHTHIWEFSREKTFREHSSLLDSRSIFILTSGNFREKKLSGNTRSYWILGRFSYSHLGIFERKNFQGTLVLVGFSVDFHTHIWEFSREKTFREHSSLLDSRSIFILTSGNFREKKLSGNTRPYWILGRFSYSHLGIFERKNFQGTLVLIGFSVDFHTHIWEFSREKTFREHSSLLDSRSIFILTSGNFREKKLSGNTRPYWILGRFSYSHLGIFERKNFQGTLVLIGFSVDFHTHIWEFSREKTFREHSSLLDSRSIFILTSGNFREKKLSGNTRPYWILGRFSYSHLGIFERKSQLNSPKIMFNFNLNTRLRR